MINNNKGSCLVMLLFAVTMMAGILVMVGCTDSEQEKEMARQKRYEEYERQQQEQRQKDDTQRTTETEQPKEEEKQANPEPEKVTDVTYHFQTNEFGTKDCDDEGTATACGINFEHCGSNDHDRADSYYCLTNVRVWQTEYTHNK